MKGNGKTSGKMLAGHLLTLNNYCYNEMIIVLEKSMIAYNIFLIGFMGTGKSTIAAAFGEKYGMEVVEMDEILVQREGMSISDIFTQSGEEYFRSLETQFLGEMRRETNKIVSCGGGVVLRKENVVLMRENGKIVLLTASPEEILERVKNDSDRPILQGRKNIEAIKELMAGRRTKYEDAADIIVQTDGKSKDKICEEIMNKLQRVKEREENV